MHPRAVNYSERGFTLVEVLIALALTALMTGLLFEALHTYAKIGTAGREHIARKEQTSSVRQFVATQLRETVPFALRDGTKLQTLFYADEDGLIYVGGIPGYRSSGGLHRNALYADRDGDAIELAFAYERLEADDDGHYDSFAEGPPANSRALLTGLSSLTFSYFGTSGSDNEPAWQERWEATDELPQLVRIRLTDDDGRTETIVTRIYNHQPVNHIALAAAQGPTVRRAARTRANAPLPDPAAAVDAEPMARTR